MTYLQLAYLHLATIFPAFLIGTFLLLNHKGTTIHKRLGKTYMVLMMLTAIITLFMSVEVGPNIFKHFGFVHLLSIFVLVLVPSAYISARNGDIKRHRNSMVGLYLGGILTTGAFTFLPGRLLHEIFIL